jgi:hypothetical protein
MNDLKFLLGGGVDIPRATRRSPAAGSFARLGGQLSCRPMEEKKSRDSATISPALFREAGASDPPKKLMARSCLPK